MVPVFDGKEQLDSSKDLTSKELTKNVASFQDKFETEGAAALARDAQHSSHDF